MEDIKKTKSEKIGEFFRTNSVNIVLILICVVYIFYGIIDISSDKKTIEEIIADGVLAFIVSIIIKSLFRKKAIISGLSSDKFISTTNTYGSMLETHIAPYTNECEKYCVYKNKTNLELAQKRKLLQKGMNFDKFKKGEYDIEFNNIKNQNLKKKKLKLLKDIRHIKVFNISMVLITNCYDSSQTDKELLGVSLKKYQGSSFASNVLIGLVIMFLFGYYSFGKGEFYWENIIWCAIQIAIYVGLGLLEYLKTYEFVTETLRGKIKRIISYIDDFTNVRTKFPHLLEEEKEKECEAKNGIIRQIQEIKESK